MNLKLSIQVFFANQRNAAWLITLCIIGFVLANGMNLIVHLFHAQTNVFSWFELSLNPLVFIKKPWTIITFQFVHVNALHGLINILFIYAIVQLYELYLPKQSSLWVFIFGGLSGAAFALLAFTIIPKFNVDSFLTGASAGLYALFFAVYAVNKEHLVNIFIWQIPLKYLAWVALAASLLMMFGINQSAAACAHIGGAFFGYIYVFFLHKGTNLLAPFQKLLNNSKKNIQKSMNPSKKHLRVSLDEKEETLNQILDKINRSGYDSLSKEEKSFLNQYSDK